MGADTIRSYLMLAADIVIGVRVLLWQRADTSVRATHASSAVFQRLGHFQQLGDCVPISPGAWCFEDPVNERKR
jgi:hypothetical protein